MADRCVGTREQDEGEEFRAFVKGAMPDRVDGGED